MTSLLHLVGWNRRWTGKGKLGVNEHSSKRGMGTGTQKDKLSNMCCTVIWMKSWKTDSQQCGIQEDSMCRVDSISDCNIHRGYKGDSDDTTNTTSSINMDDIETEGTDTASSVVRACDDVYHSWGNI